MTSSLYDAVIIGAGAAGLSAATVLARAHRTVLIIDNGKQSNLVSKEAHAVFTRDKTPPKELYSIANQQLSQYQTVTTTNETALSVRKRDDRNFEITTDRQNTVAAKTILLSQGMRYIPVEIPGVANLFGTKAWHCPYCDGYEASGKKVLAIYNSESQVHMKKMLPIWIDELRFVLPEEVTKVEESNDGVNVYFTNNTTASFDQLAIQTTLEQRDALHAQLGCQLTETSRIVVNEFNETSVSGVFAAGDQANEKSQVNLAVASGHSAGIGINVYLSDKPM